MASLGYDVDTEALGAEIRQLAEGLLEQIELGDVTRAVALVGELNEIRDRTLYYEIGRLTRSLHEAIKNLHLDSGVGASSEIGEATDKLAYVLEMTDKSANRTMDLVEAGMPIAQNIITEAERLEVQWHKFLKKELNSEDFRKLCKEITAFFKTSSDGAQQLQKQLTDIVLAQDFQDLTGQVIHKVANLVKDVEARLVQLVVMAGQVDMITGIQHLDLDSDIKNNQEQNLNIAAEGPQIDKTKIDVVANQDDVDDLLSSLGF